MRPATRLLAAVAKAPSQYLNAYAPTGLTGILTHPHPRPALLYLYSSTLDKLSKLPSSSAYRQSTEALTRHRLSIVDAVLPAGFEAWQQHIADVVIPQINSKELVVLGEMKQLEVRGKPYLFQTHETQTFDDREADAAWDGEAFGVMAEGPRRSAREAKVQARQLGKDKFEEQYAKGLLIENEPALTKDQVGELEERIGGGLIEEVIRVAEREHELVDVMLENKVWEELEEKPIDGQWDYAQRDTSTGGTQKPA